MTHAHMAAFFVIGRITERLKGVIKDEKTKKEVQKIIEEEFCEIFKDFMDTTAIH